MKKKYQELLNVFLLLILYFGILMFPKLIIECGISAITIFKEKLFPSIFPFFVLSFLMLNLGYGNYLSILFENMIYTLFHIRGQAAFVIIMSIISGFPSGPKYISKLYEKGSLSKDEGNYLLLFTHFANPLFILGTVGGLLHSVKLAIIILIVQILSNFIIGILLRPKKRPKENIVMKNKLKDAYYHNHSSLLIALPDAINGAMEVLLFMLGSICFFMFASKVATSIFHFSQTTEAFVTGILDLTSGISLVSKLAFSPFLLAVLMLSFVTFGSFSVHLQAINAIRNTDLSYYYFFIGRIIQTAISLTLFFLVIWFLY